MKQMTSVLLLVLALIAGCKEKPQVVVPPPASPHETTATKSAATVTPTEPAATETKLESTQAPLVVTAPAGSAEATFQRILIAFQDGRLDTAFDFLPASYQGDAEKLVQEFAKKMDAELWSKAFDTLTKLAKVMKSRKSMILEFEMIKRAQVYESIKAQWDAIANGIFEVATSEISSIDSLKRADVKNLLSSASDLLRGVPLPKFGNVTVQTVNSSDNHATLSYRESKEGEPTQVDFVKVEGKWLPKSIATGWSDAVRDARARLECLPAQVAALKPQVTQQLEGIGGVLDKMQSAKTQDEFNRLLVELSLSIRLAALTAQDAMLDATLNPRGDDDVRLEINRELKDSEQTQLEEAVRASLPNATVDYEIISNDGKTRCRFTPVPDAQLLVGVLRKHYDTADVRLNAEKKTIYVELK